MMGQKQLISKRQKKRLVNLYRKKPHLVKQCRVLVKKFYIEDLGKRATFLIPSVKVYNRKYSKSRQSVAKTIHNFLTLTFSGYTCASGNIYGYFAAETAEYDELREFRVAFKEDEKRTKVPKLQMFLAELCDDIGEECIYLECGEDAMLVYPK